MLGSLPDLAGEATPAPPQGLCPVLQSSPTPSRAWAADSGPANACRFSTEPAEQGDRRSRVGWVTP